MDESILRELWGQLVLVDRICSTEEKELVYQDQSNRSLKIYVYREPNHNRPHIHAYWKKEYKISIAIKDREVLAGEFPGKYLKPLKQWIEKNQSDLLEAWGLIQEGVKPELSWAKNA